MILAMRVPLAPRSSGRGRPTTRIVRRAALGAGLALALVLPVAGPAQDDAANIEGATLVLRDMMYVVSDGSRNELLVEAATALVWPAKDEARLQQVHARMGSKAPGGVPGGGLEKRCERGTFDLQTRDFVATGNVRGVTADGRRFKTDKLRYRAADGLVWSDSAVVLRDRGALIEGTGFEYLVREDRFKLRDARIRQEGM